MNLELMTTPHDYTPYLEGIERVAIRYLDVHLVGSSYEVQQRYSSQMDCTLVCLTLSKISHHKWSEVFGHNNGAAIPDVGSTHRGGSTHR